MSVVCVCWGRGGRGTGGVIILVDGRAYRGIKTKGALPAMSWYGARLELWLLFEWEFSFCVVVVVGSVFVVFVCC